MQQVFSETAQPISFKFGIHVCHDDL
jgi:hypothetical protein